MKLVKFRDWEFNVDTQVTKATYSQVTIGGAESCTCDYCKNFANYRDRVYPDEIKRLFAELGIDINKEVEVCHFSKLENGLHQYGGWFHFKGNFTGKNCRILASNGYNLDLSPITEDFSIGFANENSLTFFDDKENLVQIEFNAKIPWTIDKKLETSQD